MRKINAQNDIVVVVISPMCDIHAKVLANIWAPSASLKTASRRFHCYLAFPPQVHPCPMEKGYNHLLPGTNRGMLIKQNPNFLDSTLFTKIILTF